MRWPSTIQDACRSAFGGCRWKRAARYFGKISSITRMNTEGITQVRQKMEERRTLVSAYFGSGRLTLFSAHEAFTVAKNVLNA